MEERLGSVQVAQRRSQPPIEQSTAQWPVQHVVTHQRQVQNPHFVAIVGAREGLKPVQPDRRHHTAMIMREHHVARYLGADGLRVVVVEHQPVHVARQVFHGAGNTSVGRKVLAPQHVHIHTALIDPLVAGGMSRRYGHWLFDAAI